jgi:hypothetical protein
MIYKVISRLGADISPVTDTAYIVTGIFNVRTCQKYVQATSRVYCSTYSLTNIIYSREPRSKYYTKEANLPLTTPTFPLALASSSHLSHPQIPNSTYTKRKEKNPVPPALLSPIIPLSNLSSRLLLQPNPHNLTSLNSRPINRTRESSISTHIHYSPILPRSSKGH